MRQSNQAPEQSDAEQQDVTGEDREDSPENVNQEVEGRDEATGEGEPPFPDVPADEDQADSCRIIGSRIQELDDQIEELREAADRYDATNEVAYLDRQAQLQDRRETLKELYERLCNEETEVWHDLQEEINDKVERALDDVAAMLEELAPEQNGSSSGG